MKLHHRLGLTAALLLTAALPARTATIPLSTVPLFLSEQMVPMVMLVLSRDESLYYEAYNDLSNLDGDASGSIDTNFRPGFTYLGYFNSTTCYAYTNDVFVPKEVATGGICSGSSNARWNGNYLNYLTTSRIDALRKVLYGGKRSTDSAGTTILERSYIPLDAHSWGKSFESAAKQGFKISDYTPYDEPASGKKIFFSNTTTTKNKESCPDNCPPLLQVVTVDSSHNIWDWVSKERPVAGDEIGVLNETNHTYTNVTLNPLPTKYVVRVKVCDSSSNAGVEENCVAYGTTGYKPEGLLQKYMSKMKFGLLTGSYDKNTSGGMMRRAIADISDEVSTTNGTFTSVNGIISSINKLKIFGFDYTQRYYTDNCGWQNATISDGVCSNWGNPVGEMLFEAMRYFAGATTSSKTYDYGSAGTTRDAKLGLPRVTSWSNPFNASNWCSKPINLVISEVNPSFDSNNLPGAHTYTGAAANSYDTTGLPASLSGFSAKTATNLISTKEGINGKFYIGQTGNQSDIDTGVPTAKNVTNFGEIRGLPEHASHQGSYYSAGVAYYGRTNDLQSGIKGEQKANTLVIGLSTPLPQIKIKVGSSTVTLFPFARSVQGYANGFIPNDAIVDYYVESLTDTSGSFLINFEDSEQGADYDMDALVRYRYNVLSDNTLSITLESIYAGGNSEQHMGYVISGTTADGMYLDVMDRDGTNMGGTPTDASKARYILDTVTPTDLPYPNNARNSRTNPADYNTCTKANCKDPLTRDSQSRTFTTSGSPAAGFLKSPLWYAAKYGYFTDKNNNDAPDSGEWDSRVSGEPDGYFPVTNPSQLQTQLQKAFGQIDSENKAASPVALDSAALSSVGYLFKATFESLSWSGELGAYQIDSSGNIATNATWLASDKLTSQGDTGRVIFSRNPTSGKAIPFTFSDNKLDGSDNGLSAAQLTDLLNNTDYSNATTAKKVDYVTALINYLRGNRSQEGTGYAFRKRSSLLGDIIHSAPTYGASQDGTPIPFILVGANDGMVHLFEASGSNAGKELMAFVPSPLYKKLNTLANPTYAHDYFVDGGITVAKVKKSDGTYATMAVGALGQGGQGVYALDLSNLSSVSQDLATASRLIKWEFTDSNDGDLGYVAGTPSIAQLKDGTWVAIFGNGYNNTETDSHISSSGNGVIYVVDLFDGTLIKKFDSKKGTTADPLATSRPNAMMQPALVDSDSDGYVDNLYAGDLFGNLWHVDISADSPDNWGSPIGSATVPAPLFVTKGKKVGGNTWITQPITTTPAVGFHPQGGLMVFIGTGKYIEEADKTTTDQVTQTFYALWDKKGNTSTINSDRSELIQQQILREDSSHRLVSNNAIDWSTKKGWYLDLVNIGVSGSQNNQGERQVTNSMLWLNQILFTTQIPNSDICEGGGDGWVMKLNALTGADLAPMNTIPDIGATLPSSQPSYKVDGLPSSLSTLVLESQEGDLSRKDLCQTSNGEVCSSTMNGPKMGRLSWQIIN